MQKRLLSGLFFYLLITPITQVFANPPLSYEGRRLYVSYCQLCHDAKGKGHGALAREMKLNITDLTTTVRSRSDTILKKIITGEGKQTITGRDRHNILSEAMPSWEGIFSDHQIDALIAYLRFLGTSKYGLMGDPIKGRALYEQYCQVCHGEDGDGKGVMTKLIKIEPADHTNPNEMDQYTNKELLNNILSGRGRFMPAWKGILSQTEVEQLVSYIRLLSH